MWLSSSHKVCTLFCFGFFILLIPSRTRDFGHSSYVSPDKESCRTVKEGGTIVATVRQNEKSPKFISTLNPSCCSLIPSIDSQSGIYCRSYPCRPWAKNKRWRRTGTRSTVSFPPLVWKSFLKVDKKEEFFVLVNQLWIVNDVFCLRRLMCSWSLCVDPAGMRPAVKVNPFQAKLESSCWQLGAKIKSWKMGGKHVDTHNCFCLVQPPPANTNWTLYIVGPGQKVTNDHSSHQQMCLV